MPIHANTFSISTDDHRTEQLRSSSISGTDKKLGGKKIVCVCVLYVVGDNKCVRKRKEGTTEKKYSSGCLFFLFLCVCLYVR